MKSLFFICLLLGSTSAWAEEPLVIPLKEYNPQQKYNRRVCVVDQFGDMECKDPVKTVADPAKPKFLKGLENVYVGEVLVSFLGYYKGLLFQGRHELSRWSYGVNLRGYMYSAGDEDANSTTEFMVQAAVDYHFFPRWYATSPSHKQFDMGVTVAAGFNKVSGDEIPGITSGPVVSAGVFASYPLAATTRVLVQFENLQMVSPMKNRGTVGSVGVGFEF